MTKASPGHVPAAWVTCWPASPLSPAAGGDIVLSTTSFFLPTLSESIFVVSVANRASLVSKYSWCGQPCDLEREEHGRGAKDV